MPTLIFAFVLGTICASLCYTVAIRLLKDESLWTRSHCDYCTSQVPWWGLLPILGYLVSRGKCRSCRLKITPLYPLSEVVSGGVFALFISQSSDWVDFAFLCLYWGVLSVIALTDALKKLIFSQPILTLFFLRCLDLIFFDTHRALDSLLGLTIGAGLLYYIAYFYACIRKRQGLGEGDITLVGMLGFCFGWQALFPILLFSALLGIGFVLLRGLLVRGSLQEPFAYGPALILAAWIVELSPGLDHRLLQSLGILA